MTLDQEPESLTIRPPVTPDVKSVCEVCHFQQINLIRIRRLQKRVLISVELKYRCFEWHTESKRYSFMSVGVPKICCKQN